jgi:hypothetical protein
LELQTGRGRREWLRAGRKRLEQQRDADPRPIPASRPERLKESKRRLQEELWAEMRANEEYLAHRACGVMSNGRRLGPSTIPKPWIAPDMPTGEDQCHRSGLQECQDAARLPAGLQRPSRLQRAADRDRRRDHRRRAARPVMDAALGELVAVGVTDTPDVLVADTGYWHQVQMDQIIERGIQVLISPNAGNRKAPGRAGTGASTPSCAASYRQISVATCTASARA